MNITQEQIASILDESKIRTNDYYRKYNPIVGDRQCEVVPRFQFKFDGMVYYIPESMRNEPLILALADNGGSIRSTLRALSLPNTMSNADMLKNKFCELRFGHDFEFYGYMCIRIQDKESKQLIPFLLNKGQRELIGEYERQRLLGYPIRVVLLKSRQWGGSTATEEYMLWLQTWHYINWHSAIISMVSDQSANIRNMLVRSINNLPSYHPYISIRSFEGKMNIKVIPERGSYIVITSAEKPDNLRSFDLSMVHMSEVGLWKDTPAKSGDDIAQAIYATVPDSPGTFICMESTAKGVGNFFHNQYMCATENKANGLGGLQPVFVPWFRSSEIYRKSIPNKEKFIKGLSEYNLWQFEQGATLEGINWYNWYKKVNKYNDFQMKSEFPTTAEEAFQSTTGKYFTDEELVKLRSGITEPKFIGDIGGDAFVGAKSMNNIRLNENTSLSTNVLKIWIYPNDFINEQEERVTNRFIVTVDIGGLHFKSDKSVISVFDRLALSEPMGAVERAAVWYGHIDHDMLAWKAVQLAIYYNNALLVIESNTLDTKDRKTEAGYGGMGDHSYTVLDKIEESGYSNIYYRNKTPDKYTTSTPKIGWHMNKQSKHNAYDALKSSIRDNLYVEHASEAVSEAQVLELKPSGQIEAMKGHKDDIMDTTAVGTYLSFKFNEMPVPKILPAISNVKTTTRKSNKTNIASF